VKFVRHTSFPLDVLITQKTAVGLLTSVMRLALHISNIGLYFISPQEQPTQIKANYSNKPQRQAMDGPKVLIRICLLRHYF